MEAVGMKPKGAGHRILEEKFGEWHHGLDPFKLLEAAAGNALGD